MISKKFVFASVIAATVFGLSACERPADVASRNISRAADNFEIFRRIVFYNGITDKYILLIEGFCSLGNYDPAKILTVTCKTKDGYEKHFLGLSDNVTFVAEQLKPADVSTYHTRVMFRPQTLIPDVQVDTNANEMMKDRY